MTVQTNKKLIEQVLTEAMSGKNLGLIDQVIDSKFINHGLPNAKPGPAGFKEVVQQFLTGFPNMEVTVQEMIADGNTVATRGYWTGTNKGTFMGIPATGKQVRVDYIDFWTIENGKCVENWVQMDMPALLAQLGVKPATQTQTR